MADENTEENQTINEVNGAEKPASSPTVENNSDISQPLSLIHISVIIGCSG